MAGLDRQRTFLYQETGGVMRAALWIPALLAIASFPISAQVRADPGTVVNGKVVVRIDVTLSDDETPYYPIGGLQLRFFRSATDSSVVLTDASGTATTSLSPGDYRLVSGRATDWKGKRYTWSVPVAVRPGMPILDLQASKANVQLLVAANSSPLPQSGAGAQSPAAPYAQAVTLGPAAFGQAAFVGASDIVARATLDGERTANMRGTGSYFAGGFVGGALLGLIGTVIAYASADADSPSVPVRPTPVYADTSATYLLAFRRSYDDRLRSKRKSAALGGGLLGTAVAIVAIVSYLNAQTSY
jgi:hypothetical protein